MQTTNQIEINQEKNLKKNTTIDLLTGTLLVIISSQLYRPISLLIGVQSVATTTAIITALLLLYIILKGYDPLKKLNNPLAIIFFLIIIPTISLAYSRSPNLREILLNFHYLIIITSSAYYFSSTKNPERAVISSIIISFIAATASITNPGFFETIAESASARSNYHGRAFGLFLQPNMLAANLIILSGALILIKERISLNIFFTLYTICMITIFLSGSRGGIIAAFIMTFLLTIASKRISPKKTLAITIFTILSLTTILLISQTTNQSTFDIQYYISRVDSIFSQDITSDGSVSHRLYFQSIFLDRIYAKPFFGYGVGSISAMQGSQLLAGSSHNQFLSIILEYGFFGLTAFLFIIIKAQKNISRSLKIKKSNMRPFIGSLCIIAPLIIILLSNNTILNTQNFYIFLALIFLSRKNNTTI